MEGLERRLVGDAEEQAEGEERGEREPPQPGKGHEGREHATSFKLLAPA